MNLYTFWQYTGQLYDCWSIVQRRKQHAEFPKFLCRIPRAYLFHCRSKWSSGNVPDCGVRGPRFKSTVGSCRFFYDIQPWAWAAHLTAVPRLTQPSTLRGMVKWASAFGLSKMAMVGVASGSLQAAYGQPIGGLTARVVWPRLRVGSRLCHFIFVIWTLDVAYPRWQHHEHHRYYYYYYYYFFFYPR